MTVRGSDVEYAFDDPDDGWFGQAEVMEPEPREPYEVDATAGLTAGLIDSDAADTDRWYLPDPDPHPAVPVEHVPHEVLPERPAGPTIASQFDFTPTRRKGFVAAATRDARPSGNRAWDFTVAPTSRPRRRPRSAVLAFVAAAALLVVIGVVSFVRSPAPAVEESTTVAPSESTAQPAPTSAAPVLSTQAPVPPPPPGVSPPPPPPAPSAEEISPPAVDRQYAPSYQVPDAPKKPQLDVTRAPLSATPPPPPKQDRNSSTPGDAKPRRGFF